MTGYQHLNTEQLSEIFKSEYSNLIAVLSKYHGIRDLQLAEDIVSDTFLKAMKAWSHKGIPEYPKAWLRKVAQNLSLEQYRRKTIYNEKIAPTLGNEAPYVDPVEITDKIIEDSQLHMIFVLCNPVLSTESQLCISLRILCGFSIEEIAAALLSNKEAINKKLYRAKKTIKEDGKIHVALNPSQYTKRLDSVLRVIYLIFNEGYYSSAKEENIRKEMCWEAMRLSLFLSQQDMFSMKKIYALIALMCFHASRLEARMSGENGDLLYYEQDRNKWNQELIRKGEKYLNLSVKEFSASKYHLEATIAYWHTHDSEGKWKPILQLYNKLLTIEYSPIIAMNRTYALAQTNSVREAIKEAHKLMLNDNHHYFCLLAELYRMDNNIDEEIVYLNKALKLAKKENEKQLIKNKLGLALCQHPM